MNSNKQPTGLTPMNIAVLFAAVFAMFLIAWDKHYDQRLLNTQIKEEVRPEQLNGFEETLKQTLVVYEEEELKAAKAWFATEWERIEFRTRAQALNAGTQMAADYIREVKQDRLRAGFVFASAFFTRSGN